MKTLILTLLLLIPITSYSKIFLGINQGTHLMTKGLNDTHPYVGYEYDKIFFKTDSIGYLIYRNSYNKNSNFVYYNLDSGQTSTFFRFSCKLGLASGYNKGSYNLLLNEDIIFMLVQTLTIPLKEVDLNLNMAGESISIGIEYNF